MGLGDAVTATVVPLAVGDEGVPGEPVPVGALATVVVDERLGVVAEAGALLAPADDPLVLALPPTM